PAVALCVQPDVARASHLERDRVVLTRVASHHDLQSTRVPEAHADLGPGRRGRAADATAAPDVTGQLLRHGPERRPVHRIQARREPFEPRYLVPQLWQLCPRAFPSRLPPACAIVAELRVAGRVSPWVHL